MIQPTAYQYVPAFLARRFPLIAELEDNPIFLLESGRKYSSGGGRGLKRWFRSLGEFLSGSLRLALFVALALTVLISGALCCLLAPIMATIFLVLTHSGLSPLKTLSKQLRLDWELGRLQQIYLSNLTGRDIFWGYAAARIFRGVRLYLGTLGALSVFLLVAPFPLNLWDSRIDIPWCYAPVAVLALVVVGLHAMALSWASAIVLVAREFAQTARPVPERLATGFLSALISFLIYVIGVAPGALLGGIAVTICFILLAHADLDNMTWGLDWLYALSISLGFLIYASVSFPISWLATGEILRDRLKAADRTFNQTVGWLAERQAQAPRSKIFGGG